MAAKTLLAVLSDGIRFAPRASLSSWLGRTTNLRDAEFWKEYRQSVHGASFTGTPVNVDSALKLSTVWACVRLISETIATLPLGFYKKSSDGSREAATQHPLYNLLHNQPNADTTAVVLWGAVLVSLLMWGNAYIEIRRSSNGTIIALDFLHPAGITRRRLSGGRKEWLYRDDDRNTVARPIPEQNMMHLIAFTIDGECGLSPIAYGANVMGGSIDTDKSSAETFEGSLKSPGLVTMDMLFKKDQREEIRKHVKQVSDDGGIMVLEKGGTFQKIGFDPVSAQLLESRRWNAEELCRLYGVDPAMVGIGGKDSNWGTGLEQKMQWFVTLTLRKWCVRIEQAVRQSLLTPVERTIYFAEFAMEGLLRGDSASRAAFYSSMTQNGIYTRDDCRVKENLPAQGGNAAVLTVQSNMLPIDKLGEQPQSPPGFAALREDFLAREAARDQQHAQLFTMLTTMMKQAPAPNTVTVSPADVRVTVEAPDNAPLGAGMSAIAAAITASKERETPLPEINFNVAAGAFHHEIKMESPGTATAATGDGVRQVLCEHEVLAFDHDGVPAKIRQTFVMPDAAKPPPPPVEPPESGTVLRIEETEVTSRDEGGFILTSTKKEIQP